MLSGQKIFITNGTWARVCLLFARTGGPGPKGVSAFLVPTDTPGLERREIKGKYFASEAAVRAANLAIQVFGGYGYIDEYPVQKYMRDARVMTLYEGTSQIQKLLIGRAETGISAFG